MSVKKTKFQKVMTIIIPIIVLMLIASMVMTCAMLVLQMNPRTVSATKNVTVIMAVASALLAIAAIVFSIVSKGSESSEEETVKEVEKIIDSVSRDSAE